MLVVGDMGSMGMRRRGEVGGGMPLRVCCARPGHPPAVLLRSPASPLRFAKGDWWVPACAGMTNSPRVRPGIPLRSCFARPRPPYASRRGTGVPRLRLVTLTLGLCRRGRGDDGGPPVRPGHPPAVLLRSPASPLRFAKGDWWIPACAGMTGEGVVVRVVCGDNMG